MDTVKELDGDKKNSFKVLLSSKCQSQDGGFKDTICIRNVVTENTVFSFSTLHESFPHPKGKSNCDGQVRE